MCLVISPLLVAFSLLAHCWFVPIGDFAATWPELLQASTRGFYTDGLPPPSLSPLEFVGEVFDRALIHVLDALLEFAREPRSLLLVTVGIVLEVLISYLFYRIAAGAAGTLFSFVRLWAAAWGWALLFTLLWRPFAALVRLSSGMDGFIEFAIVILGPAAFAILRCRHTRWRPQCPECGHSLRRLAHAQCTECGSWTNVPIHGPKRLAILRLAWDRRVHSGWVAAYCQTLAAVMIRPCRAGERTSAGDRWGRAWAWVAVHWLTLFPLAFGFGAAGRWVYSLWFGDAETWADGIAPFRVAIQGERRLDAYFSAQSVVLSVVMAAASVSLGAGLIWADPRLTAATRRAGWKWTLYAAGVLPWFALAVQMPSIGLWWNAPFSIPHAYRAHAVLATALIPYALLWARGWTGALRRVQRRRDDAMIWAALHSCLWWLIVLYLAPPGVLWWLLATH